MVRRKVLIVAEIAKKYYKLFNLDRFDIILANEKNYKKFISSIDYIIAGKEEYKKSLLDEAKNLKLISRCGHGTDNIEKIEGIDVLDVRGALNTTMAEITICYILMTLRNVNSLDKNCRRGIWKLLLGNTLKDKTVGIIGYGNIGQELHRLLSSFGCNVIHYDILPDRSDCDLNYLLNVSDIITIHCDKNPTSINLINKNTINMMKSEVILINTARGGIVNEKDLIDNIKKFKYVMLDVFENEPPNRNSKLFNYSNVIFGTHSANATEEGWKVMARMSIENINRYEDNLCNPI